MTIKITIEALINSFDKETLEKLLEFLSMSKEEDETQPTAIKRGRKPKAAVEPIPTENLVVNIPPPPIQLSFDDLVVKITKAVQLKRITQDQVNAALKSVGIDTLIKASGNQDMINSLNDFVEGIERC